MKAIVIYKSKYGSAKAYAGWIAEALGCSAVDAKEVNISSLAAYDTVIYGGGLYAEIINGVTLITKNTELFKGKKVIVFTTGLTPLDCREYYDGLVLQKNFKNGVPENVKVYNFLGKMVADELSLVHKTAIKALKKLMAAKENPTEMERILVKLCDADGDFSDKSAIGALVAYAKQ